MAFMDLWPYVAGGVLIGIAASLLVLVNGRVAGISGIFNQVIELAPGQQYWRLFFLLGFLLPAPFLALNKVNFEVGSVGTMLTAGLLVGLGTYVGGGCTSGHGVCGNANFSRRSQVATLTFMATAMVTVFIVRHAV